MEPLSQRRRPRSELAESWETEVELKTAASILVGIVVAALLFPTGGGSGCSDGTAVGECESWSDSILVPYGGENGAVGMGIALAAGVAAALLVALMIRLLSTRR
jgi:hypothetical protein